MKSIYKLLVIGLVFMGSAGCGDTFELDLQDNPNAVTPDKAGPDFVYNNIQLAFGSCFQNFHFIADGLVRHSDLAAWTYVDAMSATVGNGIWYNAYANLFPDVAALENLNEANGGLDIYVAMANVLKAYVMMGLVDYFGDVPYSQALKGTDVISPPVDAGADVYQAALDLLDQSITTLETAAGASPQNDLVYGGDKASWATMAKTLKLRAAATMRLTNPGDAAVIIKQVVADGDFIDNSGEDFQLEYSTERDDPNSRHPFYNNQYESTDGTYMGNYFMWLLSNEKDTLRDPRIRHYFYRQVPNSLDQDQNVYSCIYSNFPDPEFTPDWYLAVDPNMPYCVASADGYYGRDHGNGSGIPPDGPIRSVYGLFPGGGKWDNNTYSEVQNLGTDGALGEGIFPMLTSYQVDFMRAEAALTISTDDDPRALLESGVRGSIDKVLSFNSKIPQADLDYLIATAPNEVKAEVLLPDQDNIDNYVQYVMDRYDEAASDADRLDVVMKEYYIANYGNAYDTYNFYRRTGMPSTMQPGIDQAIGSFPRSLLYASDNVNLNANVTQKPDLQQLVFWDDGSSNVR